MGTRLYQVDAFTSKPFAGNPAAVCILTEPQSDAWMQSVAHEMNLSETAFLSQGDEERARSDLERFLWLAPQHPLANLARTRLRELGN